MSRTRWPGVDVARRPLDERVHAFHRDRGLRLQHAEQVGVLGEEPALRAHVSHLQGNRATIAKAAVAGTVMSQAISMARTTRHRT